MPASASPRLAVFSKNHTNPAYAAARLGADRTAAMLGAATTHYVPQTPDHAGEQQALVLQAIAARPDACLFVAVDAEAMLPSVARINAAGIPLFAYVNPLQGGEWVSFVGSDDRALAVRIARFLFRRLRANARVLVLSGTAGSVSSRDRAAGFRDAFAAHRGVACAADLAADFQQDTARDVVARLLAGGTAFDAVLAANDVMALGAIEALQAAGYDVRTVPVVGVNATPAAVSAIRAGTMLATASFDAMKMACIAAEAAVRHLRGERVPRRILLPVEIVDADNCTAWDLPYEQRALPRWADIVGRDATV
jgi:ribose transport system substrate-binding protein